MALPVLSTGENHSPSPAGHTLPDTGKNEIGLLGYLGTLLAHGQEPAVSPFHLSVLNIKNYNASLC